MMVTTHSLDALALAHVRGEELRTRAAVSRLCGISQRRHAVAAYLRGAADRLDPAPLARMPASQS